MTCVLDNGRLITGSYEGGHGADPSLNGTTLASSGEGRPCHFVPTNEQLDPNDPATPQALYSQSGPYPDATPITDTVTVDASAPAPMWTDTVVQGSTPMTAVPRNLPATGPSDLVAPTLGVGTALILLGVGLLRLVR